jgi:uncharacterized protein YneF (UPF0154 family)
MKRISGKEMRKLIYAITAMTLALIIGVIAYFMIDIVVTTNHNIEDNKQMVVEKSVMTLQDVGDAVGSLSTKTEFLQLFNKELLQSILMGNMEGLYDLTLTLAAGFNNLEYAGVVVDGEVVDYQTAKGVEVDIGELPTESPEGNYTILDEFGGKEGVYVSFFYPIELSAYGFETFYLNMVVDRTEEMQEIEGYFTDQRNDLIVRMSIVSVIAILLSLLLTTIGLRYFTRKYVMDPLEQLNRMAEEIADGTFEGIVEVDEDSAYAALQGLLRSGQLIVERMYPEDE